MIAVICGGRNYKLTTEDKLWLEDLARSLPITEVAQGGAAAADYEAKIWAIRSNIKTAEFKADWKSHGKSAGPLRNEQMARYGEILIAFPGGRGTADMIARATAHGLRVIKRQEMGRIPT